MFELIDVADDVGVTAGVVLVLEVLNAEVELGELEAVDCVPDELFVDPAAIWLAIGPPKNERSPNIPAIGSI